MQSSLPPNTLVLRDARAQAWHLLSDPCQIISTTRPEEVVSCLQQVEAGVQRGQIAAGFLSYEAATSFDAALQVRQDMSGFPLVWFGLYEQWKDFSFPSAHALEHPFVWQATVNQEEYQRCLERIHHYIGAGDSYQVNYSYRLRKHIPVMAGGCSVPWPPSIGRSSGRIVRLETGRCSHFLRSCFLHRMGDTSALCP